MWEFVRFYILNGIQYLNEIFLGVKKLNEEIQTGAVWDLNEEKKYCHSAPLSR